MALVSGCASYRAASLPGQVDSVAVNDTVAGPVQNGDYIRVTLKDGRAFEGEIVQLSDGEIVIDRQCVYGSEAFSIAVSEVKEIEVKTSSAREKKTGKSIVLVTGLLIGVAVFFGLAMAGAAGNA